MLDLLAPKSKDDRLDIVANWQSIDGKTLFEEIAEKLHNKTQGTHTNITSHPISHKPTHKQMFLTE